MTDETNEPRPRIDGQGVGQPGGTTQGATEPSWFELREEIERLKRELAENAAMHKALGLAGFDEDISFAEAVKLLLEEFRKAKQELAEAKEMETLAIDMADDLTHRLTLEGDKLSKAKQELAEMCNVFRCELCGRDIDPACPHCWEEKLATARADALEEAAKWEGPIDVPAWDEGFCMRTSRYVFDQWHSYLRRLAAQDHLPDAAKKVEEEGPTCLDIANGLGHDQAKAMGIPLTDKILMSEWEKNKQDSDEDEPLGPITLRPYERKRVKAKVTVGEGKLRIIDPENEACEKGLEEMGFEKVEPCETCGGQTWPDYTQGCSDCKPDKKEM